MMVPRRGLTQVLRGQNGTGDFSPVRLFKIRASARAIRMTASPKGRNPGPGWRSLPMEREVELQAVTRPMIRRMYPETRSHFSMAFLLQERLLFRLQEQLKSYLSGKRVVKGKARRRGGALGQVSFPRGSVDFPSEPAPSLKEENKSGAGAANQS